jgi:hypothetical protein
MTHLIEDRLAGTWPEFVTIGSRERQGDTALEFSFSNQCCPRNDFAVQRLACLFAKSLWAK